MNIIFKDKEIQKLPIKVYNIKNPQDKRLDEINLLYFTKESSSNVDKIFKKNQKQISSYNYRFS